MQLCTKQQIRYGFSDRKRHFIRHIVKKLAKQKKNYTKNLLLLNYT